MVWLEQIIFFFWEYEGLVLLRFVCLQLPEAQGFLHPCLSQAALPLFALLECIQASALSVLLKREGKSWCFISLRGTARQMWQQQKKKLPMRQLPSAATIELEKPPW